MTGFFVAVFFVAALLIAMVVEAITIGAVGAVFLDNGFWDGWHAAWDRPGWLLLFAILSRLDVTSKSSK